MLFKDEALDVRGFSSSRVRIVFRVRVRVRFIVRARVRIRFRVRVRVRLCVSGENVIFSCYVPAFSTNQRLFHYLNVTMGLVYSNQSLFIK